MHLELLTKTRGDGHWITGYYYLLVPRRAAMRYNYGNAYMIDETHIGFDTPLGHVTVAVKPHGWFNSVTGLS